jgi:hypothetical protein
MPSGGTSAGVVRFNLDEAVNDFFRGDCHDSGAGVRAMDDDRVAGLVWFIVRPNYGLLRSPPSPQTRSSRSATLGKAYSGRRGKRNATASCSRRASNCHGTSVL